MDIIRIVECPCDGLERELSSLLNEYEDASAPPGISSLIPGIGLGGGLPPGRVQP